MNVNANNTIKGNAIRILEESNEKMILLNGCNCQATFGAGFALKIKNKWPVVYEADVKCDLDKGKIRLGKFSYARIGVNKAVCNLYLQEYYGREKKRYISYDALDIVLKKITKILPKDFTIIYPKIGSDLGGGNWNIVRTIINENLKDYKHYYIEYE